MSLPEDPAVPTPAPAQIEPGAPVAPAVIAPPPPAPAPAPHPDATAQHLAGLETLVRQVSTELLRDRRSARRWNLALRLGWFALVLAIVWSLSTQRVGHPN